MIIHRYYEKVDRTSNHMARGSQLRWFRARVGLGIGSKKVRLMAWMADPTIAAGSPHVGWLLVDRGIYVLSIKRRPIPMQSCTLNETLFQQKV
ncbi:hypothetical protein Tco_1087191 [Tanacetum coccineum]